MQLPARLSGFELADVKKIKQTSACTRSAFTVRLKTGTDGYTEWDTEI